MKRNIQLEKDVLCLDDCLVRLGFALTSDSNDNLQVWPKYDPRPVSADRIKTFPFTEEGVVQAFLWSYKNREMVPTL